MIQLKRNHRPLLFVFLLIILPACRIPGIAAPAVVSTPSATLTPLPTSIATQTATATEMSAPTITPTPAPHASRVLILSIDGLRPDAIALAPMPNLLALMQNSAYSLNAQTVFPSVTLVSHASMLVGVCPSKHGVNWNDYIPENGFAFGTDLFDIAHAAGLQTVMHVGKEKLQQVTEPSSLDIFTYVNDRDTVVADRLIAEFPGNFGLLFVHFPLVDGMGHVFGWMSSQQLSVAFRADEALGMILAELDARGLRDETLIIITADHGGHDTTHGSSLPVDMTIPWIVSGPGVQPKVLSTQVHTFDTAATAAFMLGLPIPPEWDGVPVYEAFGLPIEEQSALCP
ncbi:MAG TPA: alkaline phosphatase family protein [Anaerolineales bacterium]|nr:alkaline phosphatase family protein [Anaerolineales bacterium]